MNTKNALFLAFLLFAFAVLNGVVSSEAEAEWGRRRFATWSTPPQNSRVSNEAQYIRRSGSTAGKLYYAKPASVPQARFKQYIPVQRSSGYSPTSNLDSAIEFIGS